MVIVQVGHQQIGRNRGFPAWNMRDFLKNIGFMQKSQNISIVMSDNGMFPKDGKDVLTGHKKHIRSEVLTTLPHRVTPRFVDNTCKHPIFCGHLRIT